MVSHDSLNNQGRPSSDPSGESRGSVDGVYDATPTTSNDDDALQFFRYRTFACPHCHTLISVTREDVGKKVLCPDCDLNVPVPDYLDFDTPTEYELQYYNKKKRERDRILSPLTNPNREGLDLDADSLYAVRGEKGAEFSSSVQTEYYPVRCRVCETLMHATRDMLGKTIVCPDCGTKTVVTDALKRQQDALNVSFQPRERGTYNVGEIPEAPMIAMQRMDGKTVLIDPKRKTIAPSVKSAASDTKGAKNLKESFDDLSFNHPSVASLKRKKGRFERWLEKRAEQRERKLEERENLAKYLPAMVLRRKNGELVWAQPSPPRPAPLFNKTFQAAWSQEIWARAGILFLCFLALACLECFVMRPDREIATTQSGTIAGAFSEFEMLFTTCVILPLTIITSSFLGLFFWSTYCGGNSGARMIVEWRSEDLIGFFLYGLWFLVFMICCCLPGTLISAALTRFFESTIAPPPLLELVGSNLVFVASLWIFFPIFWISTHQTDMFFCPITLSVFTSFFSKFHIWLEFYLCSSVLFFVPVFLTLLAFKTNFLVILAPIAAPLSAVFYGLFLGRLSWILDDEVRLMDFDDE